jgi:hypothetical protein
VTKTGGIFHWLVIGPMAAALCLAGFASDKIADQAKQYQTALETMKGQESSKLYAQLEAWEFQVLDSWKAENPTSKEVGKHNRTKVKFSKQEYSEVFGPGGSFRVVIYNKLVGTDASHIGEIDGSGQGIMKDAKINLEQFTVVRLVFKDDKLAHVRVWPKLDQSAFSGGTWLRR